MNYATPSGSWNSVPSGSVVAVYVVTDWDSPTILFRKENGDWVELDEYGNSLTVDPYDYKFESIIREGASE